MEREFSVDRALKEIDGISSLETARMTLRWALERLRLLESRVSTAEARAGELASSAENATRAVADLRHERDLARKEEQRVKVLAASLETRLSALGHGGMTAAAQARSDAELTEREESIRRREERQREQSEADRVTAERELRTARERAEREVKAQLELDREELHRSLASAKEELSTRFVSYHEDEIRLRMRQKAVEDKALALDRQVETRKLELEKTSAAEVAAARSHMDAEIASLQAQWSSERTLLLDELTSWRGRARSLVPEIVALGDRLHTAEKEDSDLKIALDRAHDAARRAEAALQEERDDRRADSRHLGIYRAEVADYGRRVEELQAELRAQVQRTEHATRARDDLAAALTKRENALSRMEDILAARLLDAERLLIARYDAWAAHEVASRRQGHAWLSEIENRKRESDAALEQIVHLRQELIEEIAKRRAIADPIDNGGEHNG